jgi:hemerythrin-like domain-containing protein
MSQVIDTLMREHRFIEKLLGSLQVFVEQLEVDQQEARKTIADFVEFFREFADRCHHGKEEDQLFATLGDNGFPRDAGPLFVMVGEHNIGRQRIKELSAIAGGEGPLSEQEIREIRASAGAFIPMLRMHIQKEDEILFPAAERALSPEVFDDLAAGFDDFEQKVMGDGAHERLHALGERLIEEFPPPVV